MTDQEFVEMIVQAIVDHPDDVKTEKTVDDRGTLISLTVNPEDMGKIIGKGGRTVNSVRKLLHVFGAKTDERVNLKIFEPGGGEVHAPEDHEMDHHDAPAVKAAEPEAMPEPEPEPVKKDDKSDLDDVPTEVLV